MSQNRLSNIAILNIERSRTDELDREKIIDNFVNAKARKKNVLKLILKNYILLTDLYCFFIIV